MAQVVLVHLGEEIPVHAKYAIKQASHFVEDPVILIASRSALWKFQQDHHQICSAIALEDIKRSEEHLEFNRISSLDREFRDGFWTYTTERFFVLQDFISSFGLEQSVHIESDVMVYCNIEKFTADASKIFSVVAAPFDNDSRCIPSFVYIPGPNAVSELAGKILDILRSPENECWNDMMLLARTKIMTEGRVLQNLPVLPNFFDLPLRNLLGDVAVDEEIYSKHAQELGFIFDAAAIGQFLDGVDRRNVDLLKLTQFESGFVNERCLFDASAFNYCWGKNEDGAKIPYVRYIDKCFPIANIHVHSKNLQKFGSFDYE